VNDSTEDVEIIEKAEDTIRGIISDIDKAMQNGSLMGSVILTTCALDVVAVLRAGGKRDEDKFTVLFNRFVEEYLPQYHKLDKKLYGKLRSDLVHFYSATDFVYTDSSRHPEIQNLSVIGGKHFIVVDVFVKDATEAILKYLEDLKNDPSKPEILRNLVKAIGKNPLLGPLEFDELRASFSAIPVTGGEHFPPVTGG
jgi:hypothetical protein